jgi:hypothetical protein
MSRKNEKVIVKEAASKIKQVAKHELKQRLQVARESR